MKICVDEIKRSQRVSSRPNFIVLLGDRYGWRPLPAEIPASEFNQIESLISDDGDKELLARWYRRDENAKYKRDQAAEPEPVYSLQPRRGESVDYEVWESKVDRPLRRTLLSGVEEMKLYFMGVQICASAGLLLFQSRQ